MSRRLSNDDDESFICFFFFCFFFFFFFSGVITAEDAVALQRCSHVTFDRSQKRPPHLTDVVIYEGAEGLRCRRMAHGPKIIADDAMFLK